MSVTIFGLDLTQFRRIFSHSKIRLRAKVSPEDIFNLIFNQGYHSSTIFSHLEPLAPSHYLPTLKQLLRELNDQQETKTRQFVNREWKALKSSRILKSAELLRLVSSIEEGDVHNLNEIMNRNGISELFPQESALFYDLFTNIAKNMFIKSITAIISTSFKEYADSNANEVAKLLPSIIKNEDELQQKCEQMRILLRGDFYDRLFDAVYKIGMSSQNVVCFLKKSTFPAFEEDLRLLLSRIPSLNSNIKILTVLMAVYLFLESDYFLEDGIVSNLIISYYECEVISQQLAASTGLDEHPEDYNAIDKILGSLAAAITRPSTREIMVVQIHQYNDLVRSLFKLRQHVKDVQTMEAKNNIVSVIYDDNPAQNNATSYHDQLSAAKKLFDEVIGSLPSTIRQEYKKAINFFILGNFDKRRLLEIYALFQKEKNPSIYIVRLYENLSGRSLSNRSFEPYQVEKSVDLGSSFYTEKVQSKIADDLLLQRMSFRSEKEIRINSEQKIQSSEMPLQTNPCSEDFRGHEKPLSFLVILLPIGNLEGAILRDDDTNKQYAFSKKKSGTLQFYIIIEMTKSQVSRLKAISFEKGRQKIYNRGWLKSQNRSGLWIINEKIDQVSSSSKILLLPHQAMFKLLKGQQQTQSQRQIEWISLLAEMTRQGPQKFDLCSLAACIESKNSPLSSLFFISFMYFLLGSRAYQIIIRLSLLQRLYFLEAASRYLQNGHPDSKGLIFLYRRLHLKKIVSKPVAEERRELQALLTDIFQHYPQIIDPKKMYQLAKVFPQEIATLNQLVLHHILSQPEFDAYHFIELKLIHIRKGLQDQNSEGKYSFFLGFIEELNMLASKDCRRTQQGKIFVVKHMLHLLERTLVNRNFFFSRQICLSSWMIAELYRRSKALTNQLPQIGQLLVGKLWIHMHLRVEDKHLNNLILALLARPQFPQEKNRLRDFFRSQPIPFTIIQQLIELELQDNHQGDSEMEELNYLLVEYLINNPHIEKILEQLLLYLEQKYVHLRGEGKQPKLVQKFKLAIKKAGDIIARANSVRRAGLTTAYRGVYLKMQKSWARSMLERQIQRNEGSQQQIQKAKMVTSSVLAQNNGS